MAVLVNLNPARRERNQIEMRMSVRQSVVNFSNSYRLGWPFVCAWLFVCTGLTVSTGLAVSAGRANPVFGESTSVLVQDETQDNTQDEAKKNPTIKPQAEPQSEPQEISIVSRATTSGTVQSIRRGRLELIDEDGARQVFLIQQSANGAIAVDGGKAIFRLPAQIKVVGKMPVSVLQTGSTIKATIKVNRSGRCREPISSIYLADLDAKLSVVERSKPESSGEPFLVEIIARVTKISSKSLQVTIPANQVISKQQLSIPLHEAVVVDVAYDTLNFVQQGDIVKRCLVGKLNTGDSVVGEIEIELLPRAKLTSRSLDERLQQQYAHLSNQPRDQPRVERSTNFILHTDMSDRNVQILFIKLENMIGHVSKYYRTKPERVIECYVVKNLENWPGDQFDARTSEILGKKEGYTITAIRGNDRKSIVYSYADDALVQHHAVQAFRRQTFGTSGPYWYASGMAELAKYWKQEIRHVSVHPVVIEFLRDGEQYQLEQLINDRRVLDVGWQDFAWRWAVCHLLANNPNYADRFKRLGSNLLTGRGNDSFAKAFGNEQARLCLEFKFLMSHLQNGILAD